jgi:hypothetical protein
MLLSREYRFLIYRLCLFRGTGDWRERSDASQHHDLQLSGIPQAGAGGFDSLFRLVQKYARLIADVDSMGAVRRLPIAGGVCKERAGRGAHRRLTVRLQLAARHPGREGEQGMREWGRSGMGYCGEGWFVAYALIQLRTKRNRVPVCCSTARQSSRRRTAPPSRSISCRSISRRVVRGFPDLMFACFGRLRFIAVAIRFGF